MSLFARLIVAVCVLAPALASAARVKIFEHANYEGASAAFSPGRYDIESLGIGNDVLSSVRVPAGMTVTLYEHAHFQGRTLQLTSDTPFVGNSWNDLASSMVVTRSSGITIFEHANFAGGSKRFTPGRYNMGDLGIGNDVLSSLKVDRGVRVVLYEHANFQGRTLVVTRDTPWIGDEWNDMVSSLEVFSR